MNHDDIQEGRWYTFNRSIIYKHLKIIKKPINNNGSWKWWRYNSDSRQYEIRTGVLCYQHLYDNINDIKQKLFDLKLIR